MNSNFFESLTLDEVETIENLSGTPMDELMSAGKLKGKTLKAILWVAKKRVDPNFKMEDAGKIKFNEALEIFKETNDDPKG
jgi:hypothetical protein